ncbi:MAG: phosphoglycerate mutase (2,3-diphosphoglycerate-independent) [Clostridiales bacterium GWF2_38_85]|nr:MAG: phosphoglycerate mutase (2,3-diphosphoglycerate-independent) [Clostridiales bacterium GWF2_38_85]HBL83474.1 2,3-bisphosphoglycerate-independent phosphoglycerate mutase [Clostridiales bacterium]
MEIKKISNGVFDDKKPYILTIVMDGVGLAPASEGNAVTLAKTPTLDRIMATYPMVSLQAHGVAVGLPSDEDMGNSEVGHNALGAGQVFAQGAKLVSTAIESGKMFEGKTWTDIVANCKTNNSTLHFIGLFSDGNVHSHIDHLKAMLVRAKADGVKKARVHILLDGRDVGETSALDYVVPFEAFLAELRDASYDVEIASGGGRMSITMDRYEANWNMVKEGWKTHVLGEGRQFASAEEAITTYRSESKVIDQDLPSFVIAENGQPVGKIVDNDSVIFFNFRGDRAIEISKAFEADSFTYFDRGTRPKVMYAGMLQYDGDAHIPSRFLVNPPEISNTFGEFLAKAGVAQFAVSETQKYGHVTYFWNGNRSGKFSEELEDYLEVPSDVVPFEQRPWMKCAEITDKLIEALRSGKYQFLRVNFPNGDMVGHTGVLRAAIISMEALDLCLGRILSVVDEVGGIAIITADHGNADEMYEIDKKTGAAKRDKDGKPKAKTAHTLNPVPCIFYDNTSKDKYTVVDGKYGLANIAATVTTLMGYKPLDVWKKSIVELK